MQKLNAILNPFITSNVLLFCIRSWLQLDFRILGQPVWREFRLKNCDDRVFKKNHFIEKASTDWKNCTHRRQNLTSGFIENISSILELWLILFGVWWKVLLPNSKKNTISWATGFEKIWKFVSVACSRFSIDLAFPRVFVKVISNFMKRHVLILQSCYFFDTFY